VGHLALRALVAFREYRVQAVPKGQTVLKDHKEPQEPKVRVGFKALKVPQELRDL
jgi:hypothetical protein